MLTALIQLWTRLTHLGVPADMAPARGRFIVLANVVALFGVLISGTYLPVNLTTADLPVYVKASTVAMVLLLSATLWLNALGRYRAATNWLVGVALVSQCYFALLFGDGAGNEFFFLPMLAAVFLIYPPEQFRTAVVVALITFVTFVGIVFALPYWRALVPASDAEVRQYYVLGVTMVAALTTLISYYARRTTLASEQQLSERSAELARALEQVREAQLQLVESERQASLGRMMAGVVHELNTPVGALRSASDTVARTLTRTQQFLDGEADERSESRARTVLATGRKACGVLEQSGDRIAQTVDAMKRFVSLDGGERKPYDVRDGLNTAATLALQAAPDANAVQVEREFADGTPNIVCHPARLNQVFLALLNNAVQSGGAQTRIRIRTSTLPDDRLQVEITDDGVGIAPERLPGLFNVGFTEKDGRVGMRVGLPMSKRHVEEIGGSIEFESALGVGTTVRLSLPLAPVS